MTRQISILSSLDEQQNANRDILLRRLLWGTAIFTSAVSLTLLYLLFLAPEGIAPNPDILDPLPLFIPGIVAITCFIFVLADERIPYNIKAITLLSFYILIALINLLFFGLGGFSRLIFINIVLFSALLLSWRSSVIFAILAGIVHAIIGTLIQQGTYTPIYIDLDTDVWFQSLPARIILVLLAVWGARILLKNTIDALEQQQKLIKQVQKQRLTV